MEKVSVIVPFYAVENYIEECLASLLRQTYQNIEVLCIDDQSPDNSQMIVENYAELDSRVKIIRHEKNKGLGGARNTGLSHATGKYICFVDSDDYVAENFIESLYTSIKNNDADISICSFAGFYDDRGIAFETKCQDEVILVQSSKDNVFEIAEMIRGASWFKMYKRDVLLENGIFQPEHRYYEGVVFWLRSIFHSQRIATSSEVLYYYRQRHGSIMRSFSQQHIDDRLDFIEKIDAFVRTELLLAPNLDLAKGIRDATANILKHLRYGNYLIENFGGNADKRKNYTKYYTTSINELEKRISWPDLLAQLQESDKPHELSTNNPSLDEKLIEEKKTLTMKIGALEIALKNEKSQSSKLKEQLDALLKSKSWRITAPVRKLLSVIENGMK